jgi:hypothetical protein
MKKMHVKKFGSHVILVLSIMVVAAINANAQRTTFANLMNSDPKSNVLYVGMANRLLISPTPESGAVQFADGSFSQNGDTLILQPNRTGVVRMTITNAEGSLEWEFNVKLLPEFTIVLEGHPPGRIEKARFMRSQRFMLVAKSDPDGYYTNIKVEGFTAVMNNASVANTGDVAGEALLNMVRKSQGNTMLSIPSVLLQNQRTGQRFNVNANLKFTIN